MDETIGQRIQRIARERNLLKGKRLAEEAFGVSYEALRRWTKGLDTPTPENVKVISDYLKVSPATVVYGADPEPRQPDAEAIADAFDKLPTDSAQALDRRQWLYTSIMSQIAAHAAGLASAPALAPAAPSIAAPPAER